MKKIILIILIIATIYSDEYYFDNGKKIYLKEVKSKISRNIKSRTAKTNLRYFTTKSGVVLGVNNRIIVKCKKNIDCEQKLLRYDVQKIEEISKNYFLLYLHDNLKIFVASRNIYNESYIELAHPDFIMTYTPY